MEEIVDFPDSSEEKTKKEAVVKKAKTKKEKTSNPTAELLYIPQNVFQTLINKSRIAMRVSDLRRFRGNYLNKESYRLIQQLNIMDMYQKETPYIELNSEHECIILRQGNHRCEWLYQNGYQWMVVEVRNTNSHYFTDVKCKPTQDKSSQIYKDIKKEPSHKRKEIYQKRTLEIIELLMGCEILNLEKEYTPSEFKINRKPKEPNWTYRVFDSDCATIGCERTAHWKCSNCEMALYCSHECQSQHWEDHKEECH